MKGIIVAVSSISVIAGCTQINTATPEKLAFADRLDQLVPVLLEENRAAGVGVAVIEDGEVIWEGYYGEQAPGLPTSRETVFNTASVAKTVTAETMLALAADGRIDLDEPIAPYVQHPDLSQDERYALLTPRLLLSHRGGLLNWAFEYEDGILAFDHDPDTRTSYSGAGMEIAAQYAQAKTGKTLSELTQETVFAPLGMIEIAQGVMPDWTEGRMAMPMDGEGTFREISELNPGLGNFSANSAADDLVTTVPAYAKLISALTLQTSALTGTQADRETILATLAEDAIYACEPVEGIICPDAYGHSIGWQVFEWGEHRLIKHTGSDAGENAFVYASPDTGRGAVIFVNGANGWPIMVRIIEAIGDEPLIAQYYRGLFSLRLGLDLAPLEEAYPVQE